MPTPTLPGHMVAEMKGAGMADQIAANALAARPAELPPAAPGGIMATPTAPAHLQQMHVAGVAAAAIPTQNAPQTPGGLVPAPQAPSHLMDPQTYGAPAAPAGGSVGWVGLGSLSSCG